MSGFGGLDIIDPDATARDMMSDNAAHAAREALRRRHAALSTGRSYLACDASERLMTIRPWPASLHALGNHVMHSNLE